MACKKVVIVGGGFAGLEAARQLSQHRDKLDVVLISRYENMHFRPLIPDTISCSIQSRYTLYSLASWKDRYGFSFICDEAKSIDADAQRVICADSDIAYNYLIVATGSCTPPPPDEALRRYALRVDNIHDANALRDALVGGQYSRFVVCGGGYTGVEVASHIRRKIGWQSTDKKVYIVEMTDRLAGSLPVWMQNYSYQNLLQTGIEVKFNTSVQEATGDLVKLSNEDIIENALLVWTTGLAAQPIAALLNAPQGEKGRIIVDNTMRFRQNCFAIGDVACIDGNRPCLRMSVQFSLDQARVAARNIVADMQGKPLTAFRPRDPGFIVPMANGKSCGVLSGIRVKGRFPTFAHYVMSAYRSYGILNRLGVAAGVLRMLR